MTAKRQSTAVTKREHGSRDLIAHQILDRLDEIQAQLQRLDVIESRLVALESGQVDAVSLRAIYAEAKRGVLGKLAGIAATRDIYRELAGDEDLPPLPQDLPPELFNGQR